MTITIPQPSRAARIGLAHNIGGTTGGVRPRRLGTAPRRRGLFLMSVEAVRFLFRPGRPDVGLVTGRAVRAPLIVVVSVTLLVSLAICGTNGNFSSSG